ncbi:hypothetical protein ACFLTD_00665, partial [Elusimicrobiota bacterium]
RLKRIQAGTTYYWDNTGVPSTWSVSAVWSDVSLSQDATSWVLDDGPSWQTLSEDYECNVRALDKAGNWEVSYTTITFAADFLKPVSTITFPMHNNNYDVVDKIEGAASDNFSNTGSRGMDTVNIKIENATIGDPREGYCWNGSTWTSGSYWVEADWISWPNWSYTISTPATCWENGLDYYVTTHGVDKANNEESIEDNNRNYNKFKYVVPAHIFKVTIDTNPVAGVQYDMTVTAWNNDLDNKASGYTGKIKFISPSGINFSMSPASYTFIVSDSGEKTFQASISSGPVFKTPAGAGTFKIYDDTSYAAEISTTVNINVLPGAIDHFEVTSDGVAAFPVYVTAGDIEDIHVKAIDIYGNLKTNYLDTIQFTWGTHEDTNALYPDNYTFVSGDSGQHLFSSTVTFKTANIGAGNPSNNGWDFRVEQVGDPTKYGQINNIVVEPAVRDNFAVVMATGPHTAGSGPYTVTVEAQDTYGNRCSAGTYVYNKTFTKTVSFTSSDAQAELPTDYKFTTGSGGDNGYHQFTTTVTLKTSGTHWVRATDNDVITGQQTGIEVTPGSAVTLSVSLSTTVLRSGNSYDMTVEALDTYGNRDYNYETLQAGAGGLEFTTDVTNYSFELGDVLDFESSYNGIHTYAGHVTLNYPAGTGHWARATDLDSSITGQQSGIELISAYANSIDVYVKNLTNKDASVEVTVGTQENFKIVATDIYGNISSVYKGTVSFSSSDGLAVIIPSQYNFLPSDAGVRSFTGANGVEFRTAGNHSFTATDLSTPTITGTKGAAQITVKPWDLDHFDISGVPDIMATGQQSGFTVEAKDQYNNRKTNYSGTVYFDSDASDYTFMPSNYKFTTSGASPDNGIHSFSLTASTYAVFNSTGLYYMRAYDGPDEGYKQNIRVVGKPYSGITSPVSGVSHFSNVAQIEGTSKVQHTSATLKGIDINIYNITDIKYWDEAGWNSDTKDWITVLSTDNVYTADWSYSGIPQGSWLNDKEFRIESRSYANLYSTQTVFGSVQFKVDKADPDTLITSPSYLEHINVLSAISGDCTDTGTNASGVDYVRIQVTYQSDTYYWTGSSWTTNSAWVDVDETGGVPPTGWNYDATILESNLTDGTGYTVRSLAWDDAYPVNPQAAADVSEFTYDISDPTATVTNPADGIGKNSLVSITGGAGDKDGTSSIPNVYLCIKRISPLAYWDRDGGGGWVGGVTWNECSGSTSWSLDTSTVTWEDGKIYRLWVRAEDAAGNTPDLNNDVQNDLNYDSEFFYDIQDPDSRIALPQNAQIYQALTELNGTASDLNTTEADREINYVRINVYDITENKTWDGGAAAGGDGWDTGNFDDAPHWRPVEYTPYQVQGASGTWGYAYGAGDSTPTWTDTRQYRVRIRVYDRAGNFKLYADTVTFTYDEYSPSPERPDSLVTSITDGSHINTTFANITGTSQDDVLLDDIDPVNVKIRRDDTLQYWGGSSWTGETWISASGGTSWTRAIGAAFWVENTSYTVISRAKDKAGNYEAFFTTFTFVYDIDEPDAKLTYPTLNGYISQTGLVQGTASDTSAGLVNKVELRLKDLDTSTTYYVEGSGWISVAEDSAWNDTTLSANATSWTFNYSPWSTGKSYQAEVRSQDKAGNWQVAYDTVPFSADFTDPDTILDEPVEGSTYDTLASIKGTSSDNMVVSKVRIDIRRVGSNFHWNNANSQWTDTGGATPYWNDQNIGAKSSYWTFNINSPTSCWSSGNDYRVTAHAVDGANAEETTDTDNQNQIGFAEAPTTFILSISAAGDPVAGQSYDITGTAWDEGSSSVGSAYRQYITFESDDGQAVLPADYLYTTTDAGVHTWTNGLIFKTAGSKYLKISDQDADPDISTTTTYNVLPGDLDNFQLELLPSEVTAGTVYDIRVTARDEFNNRKTDYTGTVEFWSNDTQAIYPGAYTFNGGDTGQHTFSSTITFISANIGAGNPSTPWQLRVRDDPADVEDYVTGITCYPKAYNSFNVTMDTGPFTAGTAQDISVEAIDEFSNRCSTGSALYLGMVEFSSSDSQAALPSDYAFTTGPGNDNGYHVFTGSVTLKTSGTQWVKANDTIDTGKSGTQNGIEVTAGSCSQFEVQMSTDVTAGIAEDITITAQDDYGNTDTSYTETVNFASDNANWINSGLYQFLGTDNGQTTLPAWITLRESTFENGGVKFYVEVFENGQPAINGRQNNIVVIANTASKFSVSNINDPATAGAKNSVIVEVQDTYNNRVLDYDGEVTFASDDTSATFPGDYQFTTDVNKGYRLFSSTVVFRTVTGGPWYFRVTDINGDGKGVDDITGQQPAIDVQAALADHFEVTCSTNQVYGVQFDFTVRAVDEFNNVYTSYNGEVDFASDAGVDAAFIPNTYIFTTSGGTPDNGVHIFTGAQGVAISKGGTFYIEATDIALDGRGVDGINGQQTGIFVTTLPDSAVVWPTDNDYVNAIDTYTYVIKGTAYDDVQVSQIDVDIKRESNNNHWNETLNGGAGDWQGGPYWNSADIYVSTWAYINTSPNWISGNDYTVVVRAKDDTDNYQAAYSTVTFLFDNSLPVTTIVNAAQDDHRNTEFDVDGSAVDQPAGFGSGLSQLKLKILKLVGGTTWYWDVPTWTTTDSTLQPPAGTYWIYDETVTWDSGYLYKIRTYHEDNAGNQENWVQTTFIFDNEAPDSDIQDPQSAYENDTFTMIWGTAEDNPDPATFENSGISKVQVRISSGSLYWDGSDYQSVTPDNAWLDSEIGASSWTYTSLTGAFTDGFVYTVNSRAIDNTTSDGSSNPNIEVQIETHTFTYDTTDPQSFLDIPQDATEYDNLDNIYGTAFDTSPGDIDYVQIRIRQIAGGSYTNQYWDWNDSSWDAAPVQEWSNAINVNVLNEWNINTSGVLWEATAGGVQYRTWYRAIDEAGNIEDEGSESYHTWTFKSPFPTTKLTSPSGLESDPSFYYKPSQILGTADQYADDDQAYVEISSAPGYGTYCNNTTLTWAGVEQNNQVNTPVSFPGSWTFSVSTSVWTDGVLYKVYSKGQGPAGWETPDEFEYFYIDQTKPNSQPVYPADTEHYQPMEITEFSGTSQDVAPGEMGAVELRIEHSGQYYDEDSGWGPSTWIIGEASDGTFDETSENWKWQVTSATELWKFEGNYSVRTRGRDRTQPANIETSFGAADFIIDGTEPDSYMIAPSTKFYSSLSLIRGTAEDTSPGIWEEIYLSIKNKDTTNYWSGGGWVPGGSWRSTSNDAAMTMYTSSWTYTGVNWAPGYKYKVSVYARDKAGNNEGVANTYDIIFDDEEPDSKVTQPAAGSYRNAMANVSGTAADSTANLRISTANIVEVAYKGLTPPNTGFYNGADWTSTSAQPFATSFNPDSEIWQALVNPFIPSLADGQYQVIPWAEDNAGNTEVQLDTCTFTWDRTKPEFYTVNPSTGDQIRTLSVSFENSEALLSGKIIFTAETANNSEVLSSTHCWHLMSALERGTTTQQTITSFTENLIDGNNYKLSIEGQDLATNSDNGFYFSNILYDASAPLSDITFPDKPYHSDVSRIKGTATDPAPGGDGLISGVTGADVTVYSTSTARYWDGNSWEPGLTWLAATSTDSWVSWYYDMSVDTFTDGKEYEITVRAYDAAGGTQTVYGTVSFIYDKGLPSISITKPVAGRYYRSITQISGNANDNKQLDHLEVRISSGTRYWNGSSWVGIEQWNPFAAAASWNYNSGPANAYLTSGTEYKVRAKAFDTAQNEQLSSEITFYGDVDYPDTVLLIPDAAKYPATKDFFNRSYMRTNDISGTASDDTSGIDEVRFHVRNVTQGGYYRSAQEDFNGGSPEWVVATSSVAWYLHISSEVWTSGATYEVVARSEDKSYTQSSSVGNYDVNYTTAQFQFDDDTPDSYVDNPSDGLSTNNVNTARNITGTSEDQPLVNSDVAVVKVSLKRGNGDYWNGLGWQGGYDDFDAAGTDPWNYTFEAAAFYDGETYQIETKAIDNALNEETVSVKSTYYYDISEPTSVVKLPLTAAANEYYTTGDNIDTSVWGEFSDSFTGVSVVRIKISSGGAYYWSGSSWTANEMFSNTVATLYTSSWTYSALPAWDDSVVYTVLSEASDPAGNTESIPVTRSFTYDTSEPVSVVNMPVNNQMYEVMDVVSSSGTDALSGLADIRMAVQKRYGSFGWWDMDISSWTSGAAQVVYNTTSFNAGFYELDSSAIPWENNQQYRIVSKAYDNKGVEETILTDESQSDFTYVKPAVSLSLELASGGDLDGTNVTAGELVDIKVRALNEDLTPALAFNKTVTFTTSEDSGEEVLPLDYTFTPSPGDAGEHTFDFATSTGISLKKAGTWSVTVDAPGVTADSDDVTVKWAQPAAGQSLRVTGMDDPAEAGVAANVLVEIYDKMYGTWGNLVEDYEGKVLFESDDSQVTKGSGLPADYTFTSETDQGDRSFSVYLKTVNTGAGWYVKVQDTVTASGIWGQQSGINVDPGVLDHFAVSGLPSQYAAGLSTGIIVEAQDAYNNTKTDYSGTIHFVTNPVDPHADVLLPDDYKFTTSGASPDNGIHEFEAIVDSTTVKLITLSAARSVRVNDTIQTTKTGQQTVVVNPGTRVTYEVVSSTDVIAGVLFSVTVYARDQYGNIDTNCEDTIQFNTNNPLSSLPPPIDDLSVGQHTWINAFELNKASYTLAGNLLNPWYIEAEDVGLTISGQQSGIRVNPANADKFSIWGVADPIGAGNPDAFFVEARDEFNNRDIYYVSTITFLSNNNSWNVIPATYTFTLGNRGRKTFSITLEESSPPDFYIQAYQSIPSSP